MIIRQQGRQNKFKAFLRTAATVFTMVACVSVAMAAEPAKKTKQDINAEAAMHKILGANAKLDSVTFDERIKLYRVGMGNNNYMLLTPDMKYVIMGDVIDVQTKQSILYVLKNVEFDKLPLKDAIKKGNGKAEVAMFMDLRCPYCHKQYKEFSQNKDITMYVFLNQGASNVWCSNDKLKALDDAIIGGNKPPAETQKCDTAALGRNGQLAQSIGIRSIPTMIFKDGVPVTGYKTPEQIKTIIASLKGNK